MVFKRRHRKQSTEREIPKRGDCTKGEMRIFYLQKNIISFF